MARSLIREHQIRDEDNMSEAEHDAWIHVNLVTSGTVNFQDGTISGTGDVYATTYYGSGSELTGVGGSSTPASLYYNDTDVKATAIAAGIEITDGTAAGIEIHYSADDAYFDNTDPNGLVYIRATTAGDVIQPSIICVPGGYTRLYHNTNQALETTSAGVKVSSSANSANLSWTGTSLKIRNNTGIDYQIEGSDGLITYYVRNGTTGGSRVYNSNGYGSIEVLTNDVYLKNTIHGGNVYITGENTATGAPKTILKGSPDGAAELYYAGTKNLWTTSEGAETRGGIKFPATQVASSDANTLDDYDEYTAANTACTGALTVSAIWKLVKVGNLVTLTLPAVNGTTTDVAAIIFGVSIPTKYRPSASIAGAAHVWVNGAGLAGLGVVQITTGGVISVYRDGTQSLGWGTAANSGMLTGVSVSWVI